MFKKLFVFAALGMLGILTACESPSNQRWETSESVGTSGLQCPTPIPPDILKKALQQPGSDIGGVYNGKWRWDIQGRPLSICHTLAVITFPSGGVCATYSWGALPGGFRSGFKRCIPIERLPNGGIRLRSPSGALVEYTPDPDLTILRATYQKPGSPLTKGFFPRVKGSSTATAITN